MTEMKRFSIPVKFNNYFLFSFGSVSFCRRLKNTRFGLMTFDRTFYTVKYVFTP